MGNEGISGASKYASCNLGIFYCAVLLIMSGLVAQV
nr:MAG TPA: hypothetical protein [Bacteriophage sp.]